MWPPLSLVMLSGWEKMTMLLWKIIRKWGEIWRLYFFSSYLFRERYIFVAWFLEKRVTSFIFYFERIRESDKFFLLLGREEWFFGVLERGTNFCFLFFVLNERMCVCVGKCYRDSQVFVIFWSVFFFTLCTRFSLFIKEWVVLFILIKKILFTLKC